MERLTTRNEMGIAVLKEPYECERCGELAYRLHNNGNGEPVQRLAEYEETGVTPEEIRKGKWIPVEERLPETDDYILLSFDNFSLPDIGRYETDEDGGAFYPGDDDKSYASYGLFVNAWQPLPAPYREERE